MVYTQWCANGGMLFTHGSRDILHLASSILQAVVKTVSLSNEVQRFISKGFTVLYTILMQYGLYDTCPRRFYSRLTNENAPK